MPDSGNSTYSRRAVFCDRDGVINEDHGYVHQWDDFHIFAGVPEALASLKKAGWLLVLVTNQSGIARGYYDESAFLRLTQQMQNFLSDKGAHFDGVYFCPHSPLSDDDSLSVGCNCRKPRPGMFLQAKEDLGINMGASVCVGDKPTDIAAAKLAKVGKAFGVGRAADFTNCRPDFLALHPSSALQQILQLTVVSEHTRA